jgi:hypothetical protein
MKGIKLLAALAISVAFTACDQPTSTSTEKPPAASETPNKSADTKTPTASSTQATKKENPCKADRKKLCAEAKGWNAALACLKEHKDQLSTTCRTTLKLD